MVNSEGQHGIVIDNREKQVTEAPVCVHVHVYVFGCVREAVSR